MTLIIGSARRGASLFAYGSSLWVHNGNSAALGVAGGS